MMREEMRRLIATHVALDRIETVLGPDVLLSTRSHCTQPTPSMASPVLAIIVQGRKRIVAGDRVLIYGPGQYLVVSVDMPVTGEYILASSSEPCLGFGLRLRPAEIAALMLESGVRPGGDRGRGPTPAGIAVSDASDDLIDAVVRLLRLLDRPEDRSVMVPMLKREILWRLLTGEQGAQVAQIGLADSSLSAVNRAMRWIREHYDEALRVEDLARLSQMSVSSFHRHFRAITAMSPIQYQKQIRLQEARLLLLGRPDDITTVGYAVGYDSPSQFSREYRRMFGEPPGRDAARLRESEHYPATAVLP